MEKGYFDSVVIVTVHLSPLYSGLFITQVIASDKTPGSFRFQWVEFIKPPMG